MVFSSNIFLFAFLPLALVGYFAIDRGIKRTTFSNLYLLAISAFFYLWGSGSYLSVLLVSITVNYFIGKLTYRYVKKYILAIGVAFNVSILFYFKYYNFFLGSFGQLFSNLGIQLKGNEAIIFPLGISFYTFMAISYLVECYRKEKSAGNIVDFATYLSMFPYIAAGPIVRFSEIGSYIKDRTINNGMFFEGIWRFSIGLAKKVVIANNLGAVSDKIFGLSAGELTTPLAWLGAICYTFQIYYDFSGYTDMAIGIGKFFGFNLPENFNQPYRSKNITEFWRRWHMTLSRWLRDFLYIPLGGNRKGTARTYFNLLVVFLLCGLWHGAAWTFVIWGVYHGVLLVIERVLKHKFSFEAKGVTGNAVAFVLVMVGWVFFRSTSIAGAIDYIATMFSLSFETASYQYFAIGYYLESSTIFYLALASLFAFFSFKPLKERFSVSAYTLLSRGFASLILLTYSAAVLSKAAFNPFIYFRF